jgi:hypothetical protein
LFKKDWLSSVKDSLIPKMTETFDNVAQQVKDAAENMKSSEGNLITKAGEISRNPNTKGFAFEHSQVAAFNAKASAADSVYRAERIPVGGISGEPDIVIRNIDTGEIVHRVQAKMGTSDYVRSEMGQDKYNDTTDSFVTNKENGDLANKYDNLDTKLKYDEISGMETSEEFSEFLAKHPKLAADLAELSANVGQVANAAVRGAAIAATMQSINEAIKVLAKVYRGEEVSKDILAGALKKVLEASKTGALRGALVKILQLILKAGNNSALPVVLVSVGFETYGLILQYLKDELTLEELIKQGGAVAISNAIIVTLCMTYPPLGITLMGISVLKTIWDEFEIGEVMKEYLSDNEMFYKVTDALETSRQFVLGSKDIIVEKAIDFKESFSDTASEAASDIIDKTSEVTQDVALKAKDISSKVRLKADELKDRGISEFGKFKGIFNR